MAIDLGPNAGAALAPPRLPRPASRNCCPYLVTAQSLRKNRTTMRLRVPSVLESAPKLHKY